MLTVFVWSVLRIGNVVTSKNYVEEKNSWTLVLQSTASNPVHRPWKQWKSAWKTSPNESYPAGVSSEKEVLLHQVPFQGRLRGGVAVDNKVYSTTQRKLLRKKNGVLVRLCFLSRQQQKIQNHKFCPIWRRAHRRKLEAISSGVSFHGGNQFRSLFPWRQSSTLSMVQSDCDCLNHTFVPFLNWYSIFFSAINFSVILRYLENLKFQRRIFAQ